MEEIHPKLVVLVDDDDDLLRILSAELLAIGFASKQLSTGEKAREFFLNKSEMERVSLVILDRMLPDMDGIGLLTELKDASFPVLILSSLGEEKEVLEGLGRGAVDYITKPFSVFQLIKRVMNLIEKS